MIIKELKVSFQKIVVFLLFLSCTLMFGGSKTVISGTVTDQDGNQFKQANILVYSLVTNKTVQNIPLKSKNYKVELKEKGMYEIRFCAPFHIAHTVTVYVKKHFTETINVQMSPFEIEDNLDNLRVAVQLKEGETKYIKMEEGEGGKYHTSFESDLKQINYQIARLEKTGHNVNGTEGEITGPDDSGDYFSTIKSDNGIFNFLFDPSKVLKKKRESNIKYQNDKSLTKIINSLKELEVYSNEDLKKDKAAHLAAGKNRSRYKYDSSKLEEILDKYISSKDIEVQKIGLAFYLRAKDVLYYNYRQLPKKYKSCREKYFSLVEPESDLWSLTPYIFISNPDVRGKLTSNYKFVSYYKKFFAKNKNKNIKAKRLVTEYTFAKMYKWKREMKRIRKELKDNYSELRVYKSFVRRYPD